MSDNVLKIPIQLNGGTVESIENLELKDRELYINFVRDSDDNVIPYLVVGTEVLGTITPVSLKVNEADRADSLTAVGFEVYKNPPSNLHNQIAGFNFNRLQLVGTPTSRGQYPEITNFNISNLKQLQLDSSMYGSTLPTGVQEEGTLFFRI